jgi:hypothetical protein
MQRQGEHCNTKGGVQARAQQCTGSVAVAMGLALTTVNPARAARAAKEVNFMMLSRRAS